MEYVLVCLPVIKLSTYRTVIMRGWYITDSIQYLLLCVRVLNILFLPTHDRKNTDPTQRPESENDQHILASAEFTILVYW